MIDIIDLNAISLFGLSFTWCVLLISNIWNTVSNFKKLKRLNERLERIENKINTLQNGNNVKS